MSPISFSLFIEDLELFLQDDVNSGLDINDIMLLLLSFADDLVPLGKTPEDLQRSLDLLKVLSAFGIFTDPNMKTRDRGCFFGPLSSLLQ